MLLCIQTKASLGRKQEQSPGLGEGEKHAIAGRGWERRNILVKTQRCSDTYMGVLIFLFILLPSSESGNLKK